MRDDSSDCEQTQSHTETYGYSREHCRALRHVGINPHTDCDTCVHDAESERRHLAWHLRDTRSLGQMLDDELRELWGEVGELRRRLGDVERLGGVER